MRPIPKRLVAAALVVFAACVLVALGVALSGRVDRAAPSPSARLPKAAPPLAPAPDPAALPASLVGEWNAVRENCGTSRGDGRLQISQSRIAFQEAEGRPTAFAGLGGGELEIQASMSSEGGPPQPVRYRFRLSADGQTLQDATPGSDLAWFRCG